MPRMNPSVIAQIISEVEKNPILYDYTLGDFKNMHQKNLVWAAIAKGVGAKNGEAVSWKWKNLRDSYAKYKKQLLSTSFNEHGNSTRLVNWRWASLMAFLDPYMRKPKEFFRPDLDDLETERPESEKRDSPERLQESSNTSFCPLSSSSKCDNATNNVNFTSNPISKKRKYLEAIDEVTIDPFPQESSSNRLDMTDYLFLNYAVTFKKLSRKRQALLKLNMAKMFAAAELEELEIDPIQLKVLVEDSD